MQAWQSFGHFVENIKLFMSKRLVLSPISILLFSWDVNCCVFKSNDLRKNTCSFNICCSISLETLCISNYIAMLLFGSL